MDSKLFLDFLLDIRSRLILGNDKGLTDDIYKFCRHHFPDQFVVSEVPYDWKYFTLDEFLNSYVARQHGLTLNIPAFAKQNLDQLVRFTLDPARDMLKNPIHVNSGYRSKTLNELVGGVPNSRHLRGLAADVSCIDNNILYDILSELPHEELILHNTYIHVAI